MINTKPPTPCYIVYEDRLRSNLALIDSVRKRAGVDIIMAFKANALWKTFPLLKEYGFGFTASSLNELRLGYEELGVKGHSYCPAYTESTIGEYLSMSSHITFNSKSQLERFGDEASAAGVSIIPLCRGHVSALLQLCCLKNFRHVWRGYISMLCVRMTATRLKRCWRHSSSNSDIFCRH